jgi:hypothetical protein
VHLGNLRDSLPDDTYAAAWNAGLDQREVDDAVRICLAGS